MTASYNATIRYGTGTFTQTKTLTIPRVRGSEKSKVPPPYLGSGISLPGGKLVGEDWASTVLKFSPGVADCLIKTENYNTSLAGQAWNDNNSGDDTLQYSLCHILENFALDGSAQVRNYPYGYLDGGPNPDVHGPDLPQVADGLCLQGNGILGHFLRVYQVSGAGIRLKQGVGTQVGPYGIYDDFVSYFHNIIIGQCRYGFILEAGDCRLAHLTVGGVAKDGIVMNGSGSRVIDAHIAGADRALVFSSAGRGVEIYAEAARIGAHVESGADRTRIDGLDFGPGTVYGRGLLVEANGCRVSDLNGIVSAPLAGHLDIAGFEIATGKLHANIQGAMTVLGTSVGGYIRGTQNTVDITGDVGSTGAGTMLSVQEAITGCKVAVKGTLFNGTFLDLSASNLNNVNGGGNRFDVDCNASGGHEIKYPGGGFVYNLAAGNQVYLRGVLQS